MEALSERLSAYQDRILTLYEEESKLLSDQIEHWKCVRGECAVLYKARELGHSHINNQQVPALHVSRGKAHKAIELQMALESLLKSDFHSEEWTLQDASLERWHTEPQGCFKKQGATVTVLYDCDKDNTMDYILWGAIYVWGEDGWDKVCGKVDYWGLYYVLHGLKVYYKEFEHDAQKYSNTNTWEVHFGRTVIPYSDSMSSTALCERLPIAEIANGLQQTSIPTPTHTSSKENAWASTTPPPKRGRRGDPGGDPVRALDANSRTLLSQPARDHPTGNTGYSDCTPVVHLKGDSNCLKCLRFRFGKHKHLYCNVSTTWRWANHADEKAIVTVTFKDEQQRQQFLSVVKIPNSVHICKGLMTV
ncbi:early protein E2 [Papio hamadryas papillomavirus 1]|uniref:Regulatory protein E2 n=1 Tax=Papio hamadryas papillomavirus 1 TaxID=990303 RepID=H9LC95_RHPV1|nr:E2 gene product [Papio hamadryas papillomavirus 1]AEA35050.1 early protein E2 [Papio hamadryas papillomavirus 1]